MFSNLLLFLSVFGESDVSSILSEASPADVQVVLPDKSVGVPADSAASGVFSVGSGMGFE